MPTTSAYTQPATSTQTKPWVNRITLKSQTTHPLTLLPHTYLAVLGLYTSTLGNIVLITIGWNRM